MDAITVLDVGREAIVTLLKVSLPLMLVALFTGLAISLFQALTQIQEMTLSFVPKIIAIFVAMMILLPYLFETLQTLTESLYARIIGLS